MTELLKRSNDMPATDVHIDTPASDFPIESIRADFPLLGQQVHGHPLVYLDNGATAQKPRVVIDRVKAFYERENSNIHRGVHTLSQQATDVYEAVRERVRGFINAGSTHEVIFTRGTTESINLVAATYGRRHVHAGDEVVISMMEHHSNIVPWQLLCEEKGARLRVIPMTDSGVLVYDDYLKMLNERTRIVALCHVSNTLGTINPVRKMIADAHRRDIPVLLDGAQAAPHLHIDVQALDVDFYTFSSHKMFGPTGIGILYGKEPLLEAMPPYQGGGDMIETVTFEKTTYNKLPHKFEAGTPNIAGGIGLGAAIEYMESVGLEAIASYEHELLQYATNRLQSIDGLRIIGTAEEKACVLSFLVDDIHPYDTGTILDRLGIAVRTGHHCTEPLMNRLQIPGTARASMAFYNNKEDVEALVAGLHQVKKIFS